MKGTEAKEEWINQQCQEIEQKRNVDSKVMHVKIKDISGHHQVPCFTALAIMVLHFFLSFVASIASNYFPAFSQSARPSMSFSRCFPLLRFPSNIPVVTRFSNFSLRITWPKKVA
ncbi:hypothetical protein PoB_001072100 [Plakobranchus ocellatus]|uniref:Uncharacterized protein n=1 Tax=Plakobranchus ocellatus TaxID=259542 RepID=A0AAV3YAC8_9GAST|nr:hypothetical protein PoB_001072100 [Plakobranchus ocellatus]